ncbi:glycosyltransferase family 90 protein [Piedraia hortae CBS 480.64]|uniref:Glycosyltransferase family 90 protein n=1 Tax=Piedraia hortae CBS 480.64 TaxID=1314780 RepID=A0A6A7BPD6_9PEZI|nr:glycosyltransferase family 90 protein [Piedraia hortae CBS 480.64]
MALVSAPALNSRFMQLCITAMLLVTVLWLLIPDASRPRPEHPIDHLVQRADQEFAELLAKETDTLKAAAEAYRRRRGRQPPPRFDAWFHLARNRSAIVVEDFFDQIYHDLGPFWGVAARQVRRQALAFEHRISVRGGNATIHSDGVDRPWMTLWQEMVGSVSAELPDVDLPINVMDESRLVVPWEEIDGYMERERSSRKILPSRELKPDFQSLGDVDAAKSKDETFDPDFERSGPYWQMAVAGCPPGSPARSSYIETDFTTPPPLTGQWPPDSYMGYVRNWTLARSPCENSRLQGLHGSFVEPISISTSKKLFPLFGGSKLQMNNEILLPPAMYWTEDPFYSGGKEHGQPWSLKKDGMMWRGAASGGRNRRENWTRFQRHRFVRSVNATAVRLAETGEEPAKSFVLPVNNSYNLAAQNQPGSNGDVTGLPSWLSRWSDAAVVHLLCFPDEGSAEKCSYSDHYFHAAKSKPMKEQYHYKYLPDIDGNSFSGRYRAFLYSTSLPIKATIYNEWHDSRLVPWKHFVPMDNTFIDFYGLMEYFLGNEELDIAGHDDVAEKIALGGKSWAEKVLRKEDMEVYVMRLLLEFARICDDDRESMGWRELGV